MNVNGLNLNDLPVEKKELDTPTLEEIAQVFNSKLCENFDEVNAEVTECPDLTQEPFNLAAKGLNGNASILDIGGPPFLLPLVQRNKIYDTKSIPSVVGDDESFVIGACGGPWPYARTNCELILNSVVRKDVQVVASTRIAKIDGDSVKVEILPKTETRFCLLANIFSCRGEPGKVVKVHCKNRTGKLDFTTSLRTTLAEKFPNKCIGMGGVFMILRGKAKQHVMPDYSEIPIDSDENLNNWLRFFDMLAPLSAVGTFMSQDPGLDLRVQHFHSFSKTEGGHYHYDTTPKDVEYLAYLSLGNTLYRIDKPEFSNKIGHD